MLSFGKLILSGLMTLLAASGCGHVSLTSPDDLVSANATLQGQVQFSSAVPRFQIQAIIDDLMDSATVTLVDIATNVSLASGLTDENGNFELSPVQAILDNDGAFYWLEADKRLTLIGSDALFLRTIVMRQNGRFVSATNDGSDPFGKVLINAMTTAVTIADILDADITPPDLIGKVNKTTLVQDLSAGSTIAVVTAIKTQVETNLANGDDPLKDNTYSL